MNLVGSSGRFYVVAENDNAHAGGEGTVYEVAGAPNLVVKIYHQPDARREQKILRMMASRPMRANDFAWPLDAVYLAESGAFCGFVMEKAQGVPLRDIIVYDKRAGVPWTFYAVVAANIAAAVQSLHDAGHVVGDLNPNNVLVDMGTGYVKLIDTDSFHIVDRTTGEVYRCMVGQPECLAPELQGIGRVAGESFRTIPLERSFNVETDRFSLAIMIFRTLMNGAHPFNSVIRGVSQSSFTCEDRIEQGMCAFFPETADPNSSLPAYAPPIDALPWSIQNLFRRVFVYGNDNAAAQAQLANANVMKNFFQSGAGAQGSLAPAMNQRPSAEEWRNELIAHCRPGAPDLLQCARNAAHQYARERPGCPWCEADARLQGVNNPSAQRPAFVAPTPMSVPAPSTGKSSGSYSPLSSISLPSGPDDLDRFIAEYDKAFPKSRASRILSVVFKILVPIAAIAAFCILFNLDFFGWVDDVYQTTALSTSRAAANREAPTVDEIPVASSSEGPIFPAYAKDTRDSVYADYGYINARGEWVLKPVFEKDGISLFSDGLARRYDGLSKLYGYMDASGQYVIRPAFRSVAPAFSEGVAWVSTEGGGYTFVNTAGEQILNDTWRKVTDFSEGKAWVSGSSRSVYYREYDYDGPVLIDKAGNVVGFLNSNGNSFEATVEPFNSGRALVQKGGYGYADETGTIVIDLVYKEAESFSEGLAAVYDSSKRLWGYIDTKGDVVITPRFQKAGPFSEGLAPVQNEDGYYGYIDTTGRYVIEPRFAAADDFSGGYAAAKDNETGLYALIDPMGTWVFPPRFTSISS